ncbi:MAG TPA: IS110 family transposase [Candidatus Entotheonella sp.]
MGLVMPSTVPPQPNDQSLPYDWFVGIDWGSQQHQVYGLDRDRRRVGERIVDPDGASLAQLAAWLWSVSAGQPQRVAVAIEVPRGAMVEGLLERGFHVFAINPKQLDRFRDRHSVSGAKDDRRDAFVLADSVRTDQPRFRRLQLDEPQCLGLRELSRAEEMLLEDFRRTANRLRDELHRFYPQMLELCSAADESWMWDLLELAPPPAHAALLSEEQVQRVLKTHRIRRVTAHEVLVCLQAPALPVAPGVPQAAQIHCEFLLPCLRVLAEQRRGCAQQVQALLTTLAQAPVETGGPSDVAIVLSLPGVGRKITAWLFAEAAQPLAERDYQMMRTHSGVAPVTRQSGKRRVVVMRRGCNPRLRQALHHMARVAMQRDAHFSHVYATLRAKGQRHGQALRNIADRLLRILMAMLRDRTCYDASRMRREPVVQMG